MRELLEGMSQTLGHVRFGAWGGMQILSASDAVLLVPVLVLTACEGTAALVMLAISVAFRLPTPLVLVTAVSVPLRVVVASSARQRVAL